MTTSVLDPRRAARLPRVAAAEQWALAAIAFCLALLAPSLLAAALDARSIDGASVWAKPIKFQTSTALHFATMLAALSLLADEARRGWIVRLSMALAAAAAIGEIAYITGQAARGARSHFSEATPFEAAAYGAMAIGAITIVLGAAVLGLVVLWRARATVGGGLRTGVAAGFVFGGVSTVVIGLILGSGTVDGPGPWVGGDRDHATGLPITGWSTTGGDLRVPHFFSLHAMQAVPVFGYLADRLLARRAAIAATLAAAAAWAAITVATLIQALAGAPFLVL